MNGCAPGLTLIERLKATRKWAINTIYKSMDDIYCQHFNPVKFKSNKFCNR